MDTTGGRVTAVRKWMLGAVGVLLALALLTTQPPTASAAPPAGAGAPASTPAFVAPPPAPPAPLDARAVEVELIALTNAYRVEQGVAPLAEDRADLTAMARSWAEAMAAQGHISHRPDLQTAAPPDWLRLGENVGVGYSARQLHDAFVASPAHRRNLVDPEFRSIAIGVVVEGDTIWVTQNFLRAAP